MITNDYGISINFMLANQLLNDRQIQNFIASTVLPHHRTLISSGGIKWSNNQPERRLTQQVFSSLVRTCQYIPVCKNQNYYS